MHSSLSLKASAFPMTCTVVVIVESTVVGTMVGTVVGTIEGTVVVIAVGIVVGTVLVPVRSVFDDCHSVLKIRSCT